MKPHFLFLFFILFQIPSNAQTLVPYLGGNGLYGLADTTGKVAIEPRFKDIMPMVKARSQFFKVYHNEVWTYCFRNGYMVADPYRDIQIWPAVNHTESLVFSKDTIPNLFVLEKPDSLVFVNIETGKKAAFSKPDKNAPLDKADMHVDAVTRMAKFRYGVFRVARPNGTINFIDTELNLLFDRDLTSGTILDEQYFAVGNKDGIYALADRTGKRISPFKWEQIKPGGKTGFFITSASGLPQNLIDAQGREQLGGGYESIEKAVDGKWLIVRENSRSGLVDYQGNILLPLVHGMLYHAFNDYFISLKNDRYSLINSRGQRMLDADYDRLQFFEDEHHSHLQFTDGPTCGVINTDLKTLFRDTCYVPKVLRTPDIFFETKTTSNGKPSKVGLRNFEGTEIIPRVYDRISYGTDFNSAYFRVQQGKRVGFIDRNGQTILPCEFEVINIFEEGGVPRIFARKKDQVMWSVYDINGKKLDVPDRFTPSINSKDLYQIEPQQRGEPRYILFADGNRAALPEEWSRYSNLKVVDSPDGLFLMREGPSNTTIFNTKMAPLLPKGFVAPRKFFYTKAVEASGLIPVTERNPDYREEGIVVEADGQQDPPPPNPVPASNAQAFLRGGVINAKGKWVVSPQEGSCFQPLSWNMVLEIPDKQIGNKRPDAPRLHVVNSPNARILEGVEALEFEEGAQSTRVSKPITQPDGSTTKHWAYFSREGKQLTPFHFISGPKQLKQINAVKIQDKQTTYCALVDTRGTLLKKLDQLDEVHALEDGYLVAERQGKWGILDSTGAEVFPFEYRKLRVLIPGYLVAESLDGDRFRVITWDGKIQEGDYNVDVNKGDLNIGLLVCVFDANHTLETAHTWCMPVTGKGWETPGYLYQHEVRGYKLIRWAKLKTPQGKIYVVDGLTGRAFKE
ncbi:MAG: WG repeat-containing protein [Saprospiraceae bacterium]